MAVYRIGDILRMKREALGITREKLCEMSEEICSPQTLYRMECGKVKVKQEVYQKLMECMGELPERNYASIMVSKNQALNLKSEIQVHLFHKEFAKAEEKLIKLEQQMNEDYARNKQYLIVQNKTIEYNKQKISQKEYLESLVEALRCTIPNLKKISISEWPYNRDEFEIISKIISLYYEIMGSEKEFTFLLEMKENTEKKYMEESYYVTWHTHILILLSKLMSQKMYHKEAIEYCNQGKEEFKKQRIVGNINQILYDLVWNKEQLIHKGELTEEEQEYCKRLLVQAYYLCVAQNKKDSAERVKRLFERCFTNESILL